MEVITFNVGKKPKNKPELFKNEPADEESTKNEQIVEVLRAQYSTIEPKPAVIFIQESAKKLLDENGPLSFGENYEVHRYQAI